MADIDVKKILTNQFKMSDQKIESILAKMDMGDYVDLVLYIKNNDKEGIKKLLVQHKPLKPISSRSLLDDMVDDFAELIDSNLKPELAFKQLMMNENYRSFYYALGENAMKLLISHFRKAYLVTPNGYYKNVLSDRKWDNTSILEALTGQDIRTIDKEIKKFQPRSTFRPNASIEVTTTPTGNNANTIAPAANTTTPPNAMTKAKDVQIVAGPTDPKLKRPGKPIQYTVKDKMGKIQQVTSNNLSLKLKETKSGKYEDFLRYDIDYLRKAQKRLRVAGQTKFGEEVSSRLLRTLSRAVREFGIEDRGVNRIHALDYTIEDFVLDFGSLNFDEFLNRLGFQDTNDLYTLKNVYYKAYDAFNTLKGVFLNRDPMDDWNLFGVCEKFVDLADVWSEKQGMK